jgi:superfamily I DNA/RNA helicase
VSKIYFVGPAGAGKTSRLIQRLVELISENNRPDSILVLTPQQAQAQPFRSALAQIQGTPLRGEPTITTFYGLAQQHISLFFPLVAEQAGFVHTDREPEREPVMMNVEASQYLLNQIVEPRIADFDDLKLFRPRLLGQILDSMNKAAECGFPLDEIAARLSSAWSGDSHRLVSYQRVQSVALAFRQYCLEHSLLDFSLQMQTFAQHLMRAPRYREHIARRYRHVLVDNVEENPPVAHYFVAALLQTCDSAMLAEDDPGGYRIYLGADVESARALRAQCDEMVELEHSYTASPAALEFGRALGSQFDAAAQAGLGAGMPEAALQPGEFEPDGDHVPVQEPVQQPEPEPERATNGHGSSASHLRDALGDLPGSTKYWTGMVSWVVDHIAGLVASGVQPSDIAVMAPYVEDVLRFELQERLRQHDIRVRSVRPSRPLYDHPIVRTLVTLARLAHPQWGQFIVTADLARALSTSIADLDVARAQLIADAAVRASQRELLPLDDLALWQRVGMRFFDRYATLQKWLAASSQNTEHRAQNTEPTLTAQHPHEVPSTQYPVLGTRESALDLFWQQLFTDVLSQPGFGFYQEREGALVVDKLVKAAKAFREVFERAALTQQDLPAAVLVPVQPLQAAGAFPAVATAEAAAGAAASAAEPAPMDIALEYVNTLGEDIIAAQYAPERESEFPDENAILLTPAYTYLINNFRSRHQFWLDINSPGWYERVYQPLTHPYVLSRRWQPGRKWTEDDEYRSRFVMLSKVAAGLTQRCAERIYLASSQLSISGQEESGPLARAIQKVLR